MQNKPTEVPESLMPAITRLIDASINKDTGLDNLVTVLSLLCIICIFSRHHSAPFSAKEATNVNPASKLIGDLLKGDASSGGGGPDIMSLLPLLNNPQLKSKLNPATIASVLSMFNGMGASAPDKQEGQKGTKEKQAEKPGESSSEESQGNSEEESDSSNEEGNKGLGRYLNWKTNF